MYRIDLNCDMGEGFGVYSLGNDQEVIRLVSSANIACGFHAGDPDHMATTVALCLENGVAVGAHPGYPDLMGFGRRSMRLGYSEIKNMILYQVGALMGIAKSLGGTVEHVKPHGELYNLAAVHKETAEAVIDAVVSLDGPSLVIRSGSPAVDLARNKGLKVIREGFADRGYTADGGLVSRGMAGAVITDPATTAENAVRMVLENKAAAVGGEFIPLFADTICIHGDNKNALEILREIRISMSNNNITVKKYSEEG